MKHLLKFSFFAITLVLGSCGKNDTKAPTRTELLASATWKYDNAGLDINKDGIAETPLPPGYVGDCDKDNTLTFKSDGTGTLDEGPLKCDAGNPQTSPFTWSFKNGETVINFPTVILTGISGDVTIQKLTSTELDFIKEINIGAPATVNVIVEMKH